MAQKAYRHTSSDRRKKKTNQGQSPFSKFKGQRKGKKSRGQGDLRH